MLTDFTPKNAEIYKCINCDFLCSKKSDYNRHISTGKHNRLTNANDFTPKNAAFECVCGKKYKHISSLCKHKKTCKTCKTENTIILHPWRFKTVPFSEIGSLSSSTIYIIL